MKNTIKLNDFLRKDSISRVKFCEEFRSLTGTNRPIVYFVGPINKITHIKVRPTKSYGGLTAVLKVIVTYTRKQYLVMQCSENNKHGNRASTDRIAYFHALHTIFDIDETNRRQVHNFDERLRSAIKLMGRNVNSVTSQISEPP